MQNVADNSCFLRKRLFLSRVPCRGWRVTFFLCFFFSKCNKSYGFWLEGFSTPFFIAIQDINACLLCHILFRVLLQKLPWLGENSLRACSIVVLTISILHRQPSRNLSSQISQLLFKQTSSKWEFQLANLRYFSSRPIAKPSKNEW